MREQYVRPAGLSFDDYQEFAATTMREPNGAYLNAWKQTYAEFIIGEAIEVLGQHGPSVNLMLPEECGSDGWAQVGPHLRQETVDELSDMLWFGFSAAKLAGSSGGEAIQGALEYHLGDTIPKIATFNQAQLILSEYADKIRVANKLSTYAIEALGAHSMTSLKANPFYFFMRTTNRAIRSLNEGKQVAGPPIMTDFELEKDIPIAIGENILALGFIAHERLGWGFEDMAMYNYQKLSERELWGKPIASQVDV